MLVFIVAFLAFVGTIPQGWGAAISVFVGLFLCVWLLLLVLVLTPVRLWRSDQATIGELRDLQRPNLGLVFDPKLGRPYVEDSVIESDKGKFLLRKFRIGITNLSNKTVERVRVVLENCEPQSANVWPDNALHWMGKSDEYVDLHPNKGPTEYVHHAP